MANDVHSMEVQIIMALGRAYAQLLAKMTKSKLDKMKLDTIRIILLDYDATKVLSSSRRELAKEVLDYVNQKVRD